MNNNNQGMLVFIINEEIKMNGGEARVSEIKKSWKPFKNYTLSAIADEISEIGFEVGKKGNAFVVKGYVKPNPEPERESGTTASVKSEPTPEQKEDATDTHGFQASDLERWTKQVENNLNNYYLPRGISTVPAHEVLTSILNSNSSFGYAEPESAFSIAIERLSKAGKVKLEYSDEEKHKWDCIVPKPIMWGYLLNITPEPENTEPASAAPKKATKNNSDRVAEILAPLGNLDEKFDLASQTEISGIVETMIHKSNWRLQDIVKKTDLAPSTVKSWLNELRQYGIIAVSLNAKGQCPRYVFTRYIEDGTCYCSPNLHTLLPVIGDVPLWGNRWAQIKNRAQMFEDSVGFATTQDVRFALGWPKEDFDATIEECKRRSVIQVTNNIIRILEKTKNKDDPKQIKLKRAIQACRVHPSDSSEFVNVTTVLNKLGCRNRAWDERIGNLVNERVLELELDPTIGANHKSRYRDYKVRCCDF